MNKMSFFPHFSNRMDAATLEVAIDDLGVPLHVLAGRLGVNIRTVQRWLSGEVPVPEAVALLVRIAWEAQRWSHQWSGDGLGEDDMPAARRIPLTISSD